MGSDSVLPIGLLRAERVPCTVFSTGIDIILFDT
jgi:hypothetical protein